LKFGAISETDPMNIINAIIIKGLIISG